MNRFAKALAAVLLSSQFAAAQAGCFVSTGSMSFGAYDVFDTLPRDSMATLTVSCDQSPPTDAIIAIGPSAKSGGILTRQMQLVSGTDRLNYNLFIDASRTQIWGDGTSAGTTVQLKKVTKNSPQSAPVYGRINAGQDVSAGPYSDSVLVTVTP